MKATIIREKICDSYLDCVHGMFRYIKRLVIETAVSYIAVTPDGNQLYVSRFDLDEKGREVKILGEIEISDELAHNIAEFMLAKEKFGQYTYEFEKLLAEMEIKEEKKS
jgi:hypothetical protein